MDIILGIFLISVIGFMIIVEIMIRKGKLKRVDTYSYKEVVQEGLRACLFVFLICLVIYVLSRSLEASLTVGIFLLACVISGCLKTLYTEYQIKKRGGRKKVSQ